MFSQSLQDFAQAHISQRKELLGKRFNLFMDYIEQLDADEACLMKYAVGTLPLSDIFDATPEVIHSFVAHSISLRKSIPRVQALNEELFIHYVFAPRINTEPLVDCRRFFYDELHERIEGLSAYDAIVEVNYWCGETATYQTTDTRTLSALGVWASGRGRCGEESTYLVTALRSLGIPARQIYTPWWPHCDDNHAWVEAYADGRWYYLGACEPEQKLNRGWFTAAAGRALMVHSTRYSSWRGDVASDALPKQIVPHGSTFVEHLTHHYTDTSMLTVHIVHNGMPVEGAVVSIEILNGATNKSAAMLTCDHEGMCSLHVGKGDVRVHASTGKLWAEMLINTSNDLTCTLELRGTEQLAFDVWEASDVTAPTDHPAPSDALTPEELASQTIRKRTTDEMRISRVAAFTHAAMQLCEEVCARYEGRFDTVWTRAFELAWHNADELARFALTTITDERALLVAQLSDKDFTDLTASVLEQHLSRACELKETFIHSLLEQDIEEKDVQEYFERYLLNPRIALEHLSPWICELPHLLAEDEVVLLATDPHKAWNLFQERISFSDTDQLAKLCALPVSVAKSRNASLVSRRVFFVAALRTLGLCARINPHDGAAEVFHKGAFISVEGVQETSTEELAYLHVNAPAETSLTYGVDWTLERLGNTMLSGGKYLWGFAALEFDQEALGADGQSFALNAGIWRVRTIVRLPNGNQLAQTYTFVLDAHERKTITLQTRTPQTSDMFEDIVLPEISFTNHTGIAVSLQQVVGRSHALIGCLDPRMEPTEHLLNELLDAKAHIPTHDFKIILAVPHLKETPDVTLAKVLDNLDVTLLEYDRDVVESLARRMFANPEQLPLTLLVEGTEEALKGRYAYGGYRVGNVELALRLSELLRNG